MSFCHAIPPKKEHKMKMKAAAIVSILFSILMLQPCAFAGKGAPRPAKGDVQIEITLTGIIEKPGMSFCMDGAKYQIRHTVTGVNGSKSTAVTRIFTSTPEAEAFLKRVVGSKQRVTVTGYPHQGVECPYLAVYYAGPAS